jgi:hypothetical protein
MYNKIRHFLGSLCGCYVSEFNDRDGTTHDDVLSLLDRAIAHA